MSIRCGLGPPAITIAAMVAAILTGPAARPARASPSTRTPTTRDHRLPRRPLPSLHYQIRDADQGYLIPAKLTLVGVAGTSTPRLGPRAGRHEGGAYVAFNRVFSASGEGVLPVPPGTYQVYISQGLEWTVDQQRVVVGHDGATLRAELRHVVDTGGWISSDLHVHSSWSRDSVVQPMARIHQLIADGVEVVGSAEHNVIADYDSLIASLGARHLLAGARGTEITSRSWGHLGVVGLPAELVGTPWAKRLAKDRRLTAAAIFAEVRRVAPEAVILVLHPHILPSSYFKKGELDVAHDRSTRAGFSFDFDAVEILNGYHGFSFGRSVDRNLSKWFALLTRGHLVAATGGSDSHELRSVHGQGGSPRSYLRVDDDRPSAVTARDLVGAVRGHRVLFTTGPFVRATIDDRTLGEVARAPGGDVTVAIEVQAAPWVPIDTVTLYVDGKVEARIPVPPTEEVLRYTGRHRLRLSRDGFVVVRVDGPAMQPVVGETTHSIPALAVTNPIFVDVDGNGVYDPPRARAATTP